MMKHRLWPDRWILTGQLIETYNESRAKKGCHGRLLQLVEVGFQSLVSPFSLLFFCLVQGKFNTASLSQNMISDC
jgi:hypothetical protein